jgi:hypothetical protein
VALALMGLAGWYLYSKWQLNNQIVDKLNEQYTELKRLNEQNPHPGSDQVNNIQAAKEQQKEMRAYIQKARQYFQLCPPIPVPQSGKLTSQEFSSALSRTLDQMQHEAIKASVTLPPKDSTGQAYSFSFAAQSKSLAYAPGSLAPLSVQLADIKALCSVLVEAKVNSLDNIRRERVSDDDLKGPQTDYLTEKSVTNELAVLTPYEVSFRCFSSELASILAGFAASPCGLLVKTINVESAPAAATGAEALAPAPAAAAPVAAEARMAERYGMRGRGAAGAGFSERYGNRAPPAAAAQPAYAPPAAPASRGGLPISLDEKQLKVTLMLYAVKLVAPK